MTAGVPACASSAPSAQLPAAHDGELVQQRRPRPGRQHLRDEVLGLRVAQEWGECGEGHQCELGTPPRRARLGARTAARGAALPSMHVRWAGSARKPCMQLAGYYL